MVPNVGVVLFVVLVVANAVSGQEEYCIPCLDHTMCLYQGVGPKCSPRLDGGVNQTAWAAILNAHNSVRQRVAQGQETRGAPGPQPPAANMRMLTWSADLAELAQRWADQCDFKMDKCRSVPSHAHVGQSIYRSSTTGDVTAPNWEAAVNKWSNQVKSFNKANVAPYAWSSSTGTYSQVVWAETYEVGCGYTMHKEDGDEVWTHQFYVCNYGPVGNTEEASIYQEGQACSKCPERTSCSDRRFPALCAYAI